MSREELIKTLAISKYGSVRSFAQHIGISYTTLMSMLQRGIGKAGVDKVLKICHALNISADELCGFNHNKDELLTIYSKLNNDYKSKLLDFAKSQLESQLNEVVDGAIVERDEIPRGADEAIEFISDSMEPQIHQQSIQFIHYQPSLDYEGEIMLVDVDGEGTVCRKVFQENHKDRLVALNPKYEDLVYPENQVHIIGKVIL